MKKVLSALLVCVLAFCQFGCATSRLWDDTHPDELIFISDADITGEELQKRGVEYEVFSSKTCNGFLVEKSAKDKFKDYNLRLLGAPVTLTVDAASTVLVAGVAVLLSDPEGTVRLIDELCD